MYNKRQFTKANDKKVLHKVRKQWVTISLALFALIGGGALASHVNASANNTNSNDSNNINQNQTNNTNQSNTKLVTTPQTNLGTNQNNNSNNLQNIKQNAQTLHNNIINHAVMTTSNNHTAMSNNNSEVQFGDNTSNNNQMIPDSTHKTVSYGVSINGKPAKRINNINSLKLNHAELYKGYVFSRVNTPFRNIRVSHSQSLHSNIFLSLDNIGELHHNYQTHILRAYKHYGHDGIYTRYLIHIHHHNYYITGNPRYTSFVAPTKHYQYYQHKINKILNYAHNRKFNKVRRAVKSLNQKHVNNYKRYMNLYINAYNLQQNIQHPVIVNYHHKYIHNGNNKTSSDLVNSLETPSNNSGSVASLTNPNNNSEISSLVSNSIRASQTAIQYANSINSVSASMSNSINASIFASLSNKAQSANTSNSISNSISASISSSNRASAVNTINNDLVSVNSYGHLVTSYDNHALNELNRLNVSANESLDSLKNSDLDEVSNDNKLISGLSNDDHDLINELNHTNNQNSLNSGIITFNAQAETASKIASDAEGILNKDIAYLESQANHNNQPNNDSYYASSAAKSADQSIANSYKNSVSASVSSANQSIANSYSNSISASVSIANQRIANLAAQYADSSINSSIANSYAQSANNSIANSYKNSVNNSVSSLDQSIASSAARSADSSIASSEANKNKSQKAIASRWDNAKVTFLPNDVMIVSDGTINASNMPKLPFNTKYDDWNVKLNNNVTLNGGGDFFNGQSNFRAIDMSNTKINGNANNLLSNIPNLKEINLQGVDMGSAEQANNLLSNDPNLQYVNLSYFNARGIHSDMWNPNNDSNGNISDMFSGDSSLKSVNVKGFKVGTDIKHMFSNIPKLTNLDGINIKDMDLSHAGEISGLFSSDLDLQDANISGTNIGSAMKASDLFANDPKLETVDLSYVNASGAHSDMWNPFNDSNGNMGYIFNNDSSLQSVNVKGFTPGEDAQHIFSGIPDLTNLNGIDIKDMDASYIADAQGMFASDPNLVDANISGLNLPHARVINKMFANNPKLETVELTNVNIPSIAKSSMWNALSDGNGNSSYVFANDPNLQDADFTGFKDWYFGNMFKGMNNKNASTIYNKFKKQLSNTINNIIDNKAKPISNPIEKVFIDTMSKFMPSNVSTPNSTYIKSCLYNNDNNSSKNAPHVSTNPYGNMSDIINAIIQDSDCGKLVGMPNVNNLPFTGINTINLYNNKYYSGFISKQAINQLIKTVHDSINTGINAFKLGYDPEGFANSEINGFIKKNAKTAIEDTTNIQQFLPNSTNIQSDKFKLLGSVAKFEKDDGRYVIKGTHFDYKNDAKSIVDNTGQLLKDEAFILENNMHDYFFYGK